MLVVIDILSYIKVLKIFLLFDKNTYCKLLKCLLGVCWQLAPIFIPSLLVPTSQSPDPETQPPPQACRRTAATASPPPYPMRKVPFRKLVRRALYPWCLVWLRVYRGGGRGVKAERRRRERERPGRCPTTTTATTTGPNAPSTPGAPTWSN